MNEVQKRNILSISHVFGNEKSDGRVRKNRYPFNVTTYLLLQDLGDVVSSTTEFFVPLELSSISLPGGVSTHQNNQAPRPMSHFLDEAHLLLTPTKRYSDSNRRDSLQMNQQLVVVARELFARNREYQHEASRKVMNEIRCSDDVYHLILGKRTC